MVYLAIVVAFVVGCAFGYRWGSVDTTAVWSKFAYHRWNQTQEYVAKIEAELTRIKQKLAGS